MSRKGTPEHGTPLRSWINASYGANGRSWSSVGHQTDGMGGPANDHADHSDHDLAGKAGYGSPTLKQKQAAESQNKRGTRGA